MPFYGIVHDSFFHSVGDVEICWAAGVFCVNIWIVRAFDISDPYDR